MAYAARYGCGDVLRLGALPDGLHASAVRAADNTLALFVTNLNFKPCALHAEVAGMAAKALLEAVVLHSDDETAFNTPESTPLQTQPLEGVALSDNGAALSATLPPRSWTCLRVSL
jgi:alpha-L-arabinofuranosidase